MLNSSIIEYLLISKKKNESMFDFNIFYGCINFITMFITKLFSYREIWYIDYTRERKTQKGTAVLILRWEGVLCSIELVKKFSVCERTPFPS